MENEGLGTNVLEEMKQFKNVQSLIKSLGEKIDRPLTFTNDEQLLAENFFKTSNYFSFSIYRKLLPRIENKKYSFSDALNLYKFNTFLRENLLPFTGEIELMMKSTLIQQICTYYEEKKQEDKFEISIKNIDETIEVRKNELRKKYTKIKNKGFKLDKLINEIEKKFSGSILSISETAKKNVFKYSKELAEMLGPEAEKRILELKNLLRIKMVEGINNLANISLELIITDLEKESLPIDDIKLIFEEKLIVIINNYDLEVSEFIEQTISNAINWLQYNMFKYSTGECYKDLSIYKRDNNEDLKKSKEIIEGFLEVINEDGDKSDAIKHYISKGKSVPIWVIMDEVTFGNVYNFATLLNEEVLDSWIIKSFNKEYKDYILGWFRNVNFLRNACAHYTRLYGRYFNASPPKLIKEDLFVANIRAENNKTLFANMLTVKNLLKFHSDTLNYWEIFIERLEKEIEKNSDIIRISEMGFPDNWKECLVL